MPKNRTIPFGYQMVNGFIKKHPDEAPAVSMIFQQYLEGMGLKAIAAAMTVPYSEGTVWNKNTVKRILENQRYLGTDQYPPIVDAATFHKANALRTEKVTALCILSADMKEIRRRAYCAECGNRLFRYNNTGHWDCRNKYCFPFDFAITDQMLTSAILHMLNTVIANPALLETNSDICVYEPTAAVVRQENEIGHMLDQPQPNYDAVKAELFRFASDKYDCCAYNDRQQAAVQLQAKLSGLPQLTELNTELFSVCVKEVRISHCLETELELINGICMHSIVERSESP